MFWGSESHVEGYAYWYPPVWEAKIEKMRELVLEARRLEMWKLWVMG